MDIRQKATITIEFNEEEIPALVEIIAGVYKINNPQSVGFQPNKAINFSEGATNLIEDWADGMGLLQEDEEVLD